MRFITLVFFFYFSSCFSASMVFSQTCNEKETWIKNAKKNQLGDYDCLMIRNALERILKDCLESKDSIDSSLWDLYNELGYNYYFCGPEDKAIGYLDYALKAKKNSEQIDSEDLGRIYRLQALNYYFLQKNKEAFKALNQAIKYFEIENSSYLSDSYRLLSSIYTEFGDYKHALIYLEKAEKTNQAQSPYNLFLLKSAKGFVYDHLGNKKLALKEYESAKEVLEKDGFEKNLIEYAKLHADIGDLQSSLGNYSASESSLKKAFELYEQIPSTDPLTFIGTYIYLADLQIQKKEYDEALNSINQAFAIADTALISPYSVLKNELYRLVGSIELKRGDYKKSIDNFQKAIKALVPDFQTQENENPILSQQITGDRLRLRKVLKLKADAFQQRYQATKNVGDLEKVHRIYLTLDTLITQTRQSFKAAESKYLLQKNILPIYEEAIEVAMELYKKTAEKKYLESAHQFMGRNKSIILIEGLQDEKVKFATIPQHLIQKEIRLKRAYFAMETSLYEEEQKGDSKIVEQIKDSLFTTKRTYDSLIQLFEKDYPKYYQSKYDYYSKLSIRTIQSKIDKNKAVIEFFVGAKSLYVSLITQDRFEIFQSELPENFEELCLDFIKMSRGESFENIEAQFSKKSYELYKHLFGSALKNLDPSIHRLTIIPDDILLHLSFDVLFTEPYTLKPENWASPDLPYFIRKYAYHQVYSNALLFDEKSQQRVQEATKGFLGFGLEYFDQSVKTEWTKEDSLIQKRINGPLPYSDDEVLAIKELMGGHVAINEKATKQYFLDVAHEYKMLHFAMHGFADEKFPLNSALIFAKVDGPNDHLLKVADIYALNLPASMVYLSACQTNYATLEKGEGMPTISRAFAYAGCPSVVASLWNIPDKSSKEIATTFYENLKKGETKDVALRNAKLSYLQNVKDINSALPNLWSQTIMIGNPAPIEGYDNKIYFWIIGAVLFLLFIFLIWRKRKKTSD